MSKDVRRDDRKKLARMPLRQDDVRMPVHHFTVLVIDLIG